MVLRTKGGRQQRDEVGLRRRDGPEEEKCLIKNFEKFSNKLQELKQGRIERE
jgi:hypothetical protein